MLIVEENERVAASATVTAVRAAGQAVSPMIAGLLSYNILFGIPFIVAGLCKSLYDVSLFALFRGTVLYTDERKETTRTSSLSSESATDLLMKDSERALAAVAGG